MPPAILKLLQCLAHILDKTNATMPPNAEHKTELTPCPSLPSRLKNPDSNCIEKDPMSLKNNPTMKYLVCSSEM